ncbi:MAG: PAS domain S-box protein [Synechococcales cyanobacterium M58_A2018_015]|nr:PAS domain S-box protein [Synechococcales cyanobacterium M58_A2018_015]
MVLAAFDFCPDPPFLQSLIESIAIPIGVKDRQHRWLLLNSALAQLLGCSVEEVLGQTERSLLSQAEPSWAAEEQVFTAGGTCIQNEVWTIATGRSYELTVRRSLVRDAAEVPYVIVTIEEIQPWVAKGGPQPAAADPRTESEPATKPAVFAASTASGRLLAERLQRLTVALDAANEGIAIVQQGRYCYLNRAYGHKLGYAEPAELLGQPWYIVYEPAERQRLERDVLPLLTTDQPWQGEAVAQCKDGRPLFQEVELTPAEDGSVILTYRDVTAHKQIAATLHELNEQLEKRVEERTTQMNQLVARFKQEINDRKQTEAILRESEALFRSIVESADDLIYMISPEGIFSYVSPQWATILGHEPRTIIEQSFVPFVHPEDLPSCFEVLKQVASGEKGRLSEFRAFHQNGSQRWLTANLSPVKDAQGRVLYCLGIARDITEQKQAEAVLQEQEQFLRSIYDGVDHSIFVVDVLDDGDLRYAGWNVVTERLSGISSLAGMHQTPEAIHGLVKGAQVRQRYQECVAAGTSITYEECLTLHNQENWWLTTLNPLRDASGRIFRIVGTTFTITDRKRAEEERDRFFNLSADILAVTGFDGYFKRVNPAFERILGLSATELLAHPFLSFVHPDDQAATAAEAAKIRQGVTTIAFENRYRCSDGSYRWLSWTAVPFIQDGVMYVTARDVTERKQAEELLRRQAEDLEVALKTLQRTQMQMVQSEKMSSLGQLVAGVAHEINNPVSFIYGNLVHADDYSRDLLALLKLYQVHYPDPVAAIQAKAEAIDLEFLMTDLPKLLDSMKMGAERIQKIVASLRTFSRMDEAEMKAVDLHDGIDSTLLILQNRLKAKGRCPEIQVDKSYGELPLVECYAGQLNQVFMNVLSNAIDALEERAEREPHFTPLLSICTSVSQNQVAIQIRDNGPGMTVEVQQQLFNPFFTTKPVGKGTGMGLSISYQIVTEKHGGTLRCSSAPGQGTEFTIEIPIVPPVVLQTTSPANIPDND